MGEIICGPGGSTTSEVFEAVNASQLEGWESMAHAYSARSQAVQPVDEFTLVYTSLGDGTFSVVPTAFYSALHYATKAAGGTGEDPLWGSITGDIENQSDLAAQLLLRVSSDTSQALGSSKVYNMVVVSESEYNALTPNAQTLYVIVG